MDSLVWFVWCGNRVDGREPGTISIWIVDCLTCLANGDEVGDVAYHGRPPIVLHDPGYCFLCSQMSCKAGAVSRFYDVWD